MSGHPPDDGPESKPRRDEHLERPDPSSDIGLLLRRAIAGFTVVALLAAIDLLSDTGSGTDLGHVLLEGALLVLALVAVAALVRLLVRERGRVLRLHGEVAAWRAEAERWRGESRTLLAGLGAAMDRQFERWGLSPAEREVALLLVKGLSLNEIATVRAASERTVRQQAQAVYRKGGLAGRAELSAFFLEDLLLPGALSDVPTEPLTPPAAP